MTYFQEMLRRLSSFWEQQGCILHQGYDSEVGAGTYNPATFLRCLGPEPYRAAYIEPCRRPTDGRYGENPNRMQHYFQYQVIIKPSPPDIQQVYLDSLKALGFDLKEHDIRFVHDDWENPTIGAWGLGWEVWMDGMEVTQFTYFQSVGGIELSPISVELTYGVERLAMYLQKVDNVYDLKWNDQLTYGDIYHRNEVEWSHYNFEHANVAMWHQHFIDYEQETKRMIAKQLPIPAYDFVMKASHSFNILDARGAISVTERTGYIRRIRDLAKQIAELYVASREKLGYPLLKRFESTDAASQTHSSVQPHTSTLSSPADFLLEIGSEELPATFIPIGMRSLETKIAALLDEQQISYDSIHAYGSPKRLSVVVKNLSPTKPSIHEEKRGPAIAHGFDDKGIATRAALGFLKSANLPTQTLQEISKKEDDRLFIRAVNGTDYLFSRVEKEGFAVADYLATALPELITHLNFPKTMRWGTETITYARPLQWIVALHGAGIVPFAVGSISSGRESFGHHQRKPAPFTIPSADAYLDTLKQHDVIANHHERKEIIQKQLDIIEKELGASVQHKNELIDQVAFLTEFPICITSSFSETFLRAPAEVLTSEMIEHQKYFPIATKDGTLKNQFVMTADNHPSELIRFGNEMVLAARLSDGVFLYEQGLKRPLSEYNERLKHVTFQQKLGSVFEKVERLIQHSTYLQKLTGIGDLKECQRAAELSKADLASEMVYEFPKLQGTIGRYYATASGELPAVAAAIEEHWQPRFENDTLPASEVGAVLALADKIDNILGCFAADLKPSSSSDPYALRRQALGMIRILIERKLSVPLQEALSACLKHFSPQMQDPSILDEVLLFLRSRTKTVFLDYGFSKIEIEASLSYQFDDIYDAFCRVQSLHTFRSSSDAFSALLEVYKRAKGQLNSHSGEPRPFKKELLREKEEISLNDLLIKIEPRFSATIAKKGYDESYQLIAEIQPALALLFDKVKILEEDPSLRSNRIALLKRVFSLFEQLLDFSQIRGASAP